MAQQQTFLSKYFTKSLSKEDNTASSASDTTKRNKKKRPRTHVLETSSEEDEDLEIEVLDQGRESDKVGHRKNRGREVMKDFSGNIQIKERNQKEPKKKSNQSKKFRNRYCLLDKY